MESTLVDGFSASIRALSFIALFQATGIAIFVVLFGRHLHETLSGTLRIGRTSAFIGMLLVTVHYLLEAARMGGELASALDKSLQSLVLNSSVSAAAGTRLVGLAIVFLALRSGFSQKKGLTVAGVVLVAVSFTMVGHTASDTHRALLQGLLLVHLIIVTFWFGALVPLYRASAAESTRTAGEVTEAFSRVAVGAVPVLLVAGGVLAALLLPSLAALTTTYGQLLLLKIAGFAVLMLLGAINKWRLGPALVRGDESAAPRLRRSLAAEYALIAAVLGVTAVLTSFFSPH
jgi:putative copper resistance protein D